MRRVTVGDREVRYELVRRPRMRTIRMVVGEGFLRVSARPGVPLREVEDAIREKERWIARHAHLLDEGPPPPLADGDALPLLGGEVELGLACTGRRSWRFREDDARLTVEVGEAADADAVVADWYRTVALHRLGSLVMERAPHVGVRVPQVVVRDARSRWGSCSSQGRVGLNWRLVMAPPQVADYVVVHELAHLREMNHSPAFWAVVAAVVPDHREHREWLRAHGEALMRRRPRRDVPRPA
ncbi:MAG: SprT family zinc-dependent metalloprotease [Actinomycetota bacterium]